MLENLPLAYTTQQEKMHDAEEESKSNLPNTHDAIVAHNVAIDDPSDAVTTRTSFTGSVPYRCSAASATGHHLASDEEPVV